MSKRRKFNPPSEDFAETKQLLKDEREKNAQLTLMLKRVRAEIKQKDELIADILEDNQSWESHHKFLIGDL